MIRDFAYWDSDNEVEIQLDSDGTEDDRHSTKKPKIAVDLLTGLNRLRQDGMFCDITLKAGSQKIEAHKNVLCACSPYFNAMFTGPFIETDKKEIEIQDIDFEMLKILIDFMYTGELKYNPQNVERVLLTSTFLQIASAEEICSQYLIRSINLKNCLKFLQFAGKHSIKNICDKAIDIASDNFQEIYSSENLLAIDFDEFDKLVSARKVRDYPDDIKYAIIIKWVNFAHESRSQYLTQLLEKINPYLVGKQLLYSTKLRKEPYFVFDKWISAYDAMDETDPNSYAVFLSKRIGIFEPKMCKLQHQHTRQLSRLPNEIYDGSYASCGFTIYHQGGWLSKRGVVSDTYCLNVLLNKWMPFISLAYPRAYHKSCSVNYEIYTIGGSDGHKALDFVESLDLATGQRSVVTSLPRKKESMGLAVHGNSVYAVGGKDRRIELSCMHRLDTRIGTWETLASNPYKLGSSSCSTIGDNIYCSHPTSMERYDIRTNKWTSIITQYSRFPDEIFSIGESLYGVFKDHFAKYNFDKGKWKVARQLKFHHNYLTAVPALFAPTSARDVVMNANNSDDDDEE